MKYTLTLLSCFLILQLQAQFTTVSQGFGKAFQPTYPNCITYDTVTAIYTLDTTCAEILNTTFISYQGAVDIQDTLGGNEFSYFKNLRKLYIMADYTYYPAMTYLPESIKYLHIGMVTTPNYPFYCQYPTALDSLSLGVCNTHFMNGHLPPKLKYLTLNRMHYVDSIASMPDSLEELEIWTNMYLMPMSATDYNLPDMSHCQKLKKVGLYEIREFTPIFNMDESFLYKLPANVEELIVRYGSTYASIDSIHYLPPRLKKLVLEDIVQIDYFPDSLQYLDIKGAYTCLPTYPQTLTYLSVTSDPNFCHPNDVPGLNLQADLCTNQGNNFYNCPLSEKSLTGIVFQDVNNDCQFQSGTDNRLVDIPLIIEQAGVFVAKVYSDKNGIYAITLPDDNYTISIDTNETHLRNDCSNYTYSYPVQFNTNGSVTQHFQLSCDTLTFQYADSFDLKLNNIYAQCLRPGYPQQICLSGLDVLHYPELNCTSGFEASLDSLVQFDLRIYGAPVEPSVLNKPEFVQSFSNDTVYVHYTDSNFRIDFVSGFCFWIKVGQSAQLGDQLCVDAVMTPPPGDMHATNNSLAQCFEIVNSYDPNMKQTWPMEVLPGYDSEFRYTIHFQNTGNASAINVQLVDTLDSQLDLSTFQVIEASHAVETFLDGQHLIFKFNDIYLPDSLSDPEGSQGHVSYRIKPKAAMQLGDQIKNTAHIFFDFNTAIVTNTTTNTCVTSINELGELLAEGESFVLYPNPVQHQNSIRITQLPTSNTVVRLIGLDGKVYTEQTLSAQDNILSLPQLKAGVYLVQIAIPNGMQTRKLVKL